MPSCLRDESFSPKIKFQSHRHTFFSSRIKERTPPPVLLMHRTLRASSGSRFPLEIDDKSSLKLLSRYSRLFVPSKGPFSYNTLAEYFGHPSSSIPSFDRFDTSQLIRLTCAIFELWINSLQNSDQSSINFLVYIIRSAGNHAPYL